MLLLHLLAGCAGELTSIPDTTTRVGKPVVEKGTELELRIFTTESECRSRVQPDEVGLCMPYVDRSNGEVRLGFQFRLNSPIFFVYYWLLILSVQSLLVVFYMKY